MVSPDQMTCNLHVLPTIMFTCLRGREESGAKRWGYGAVSIWLVWPQHMLVDSRDMQPHGSIKNSPPFIRRLTHSPDLVAVFTCKYLETDRFLSWGMCFRKSLLHVYTLVKVELRKSLNFRLPIVLHLLCIHLCCSLKDTFPKTYLKRFIFFVHFDETV